MLSNKQRQGENEVDFNLIATDLSKDLTHHPPYSPPLAEEIVLKKPLRARIQEVRRNRFLSSGYYDYISPSISINNYDYVPNTTQQPQQVSSWTNWIFGNGVGETNYGVRDTTDPLIVNFMEDRIIRFRNPIGLDNYNSQIMNLDHAYQRDTLVVRDRGNNSIEPKLTRINEVANDSPKNCIDINEIFTPSTLKLINDLNELQKISKSCSLNESIVQLIYPDQQQDTLLNNNTITNQTTNPHSDNSFNAHNFQIEDLEELRKVHSIDSINQTLHGCEKLPWYSFFNCFGWF